MRLDEAIAQPHRQQAKPKAAAERFQNEGYRVINISRRPCSLSGVVNIQADFADTNLAEQLTATLQGAIPNDADAVILVHNAAMSLSDTVQNVEADMLRKIMEINVIAPTVLNQILLPKTKFKHTLKTP